MEPASDQEITASSDGNLQALGTGALVRTLIQQLSSLVQKEVELAQAEGRKDLRHGWLAGTLGGAAAVAFMAAIACGLIAAVVALGRVFSGQAVALIGCGLFIVVGGGLLVGAWREARAAKPRRSLRQAKATLQMLMEKPT